MADRTFVPTSANVDKEALDALNEDLGEVLVITDSGVTIPGDLAAQPSRANKGTRGDDMAICIEHLGYTEVL